MTPVATALANGYGASQVIDYLMKADKNYGVKIRKALDSGYTEDEIVEYLKNNYSNSKTVKQQGYKSYAERSALKGGMTEQERASYILRHNQKTGIGKALGTFSQAALPIAALGGTAAGLYGAYKSLNPMMSMAGNLLSGMMGGNPNQGPPPSSSISPTTPPNEPPPGPSPTTPPTPQPPTSSNLGATIGALAGPIMKAFGFKNKPLINAVSALVQATGLGIDEIKQELSKSTDLSTPEKITAAAKQKLADLTGEGKIFGKNELQSADKARERLENVQPIDKAKKSLAQSLKSSVIRKMNYNAGDKEMDIIFNNGSTYRYYDFPLDQWDKLSKGGTPAKTSGRNQYGVWWVGKNPSTGATFNEIIQPRAKQSGPYRYEKVGNTPLSEEDMEELREKSPAKSQRAEMVLESEKAGRAGESLKAYPKSPLLPKEKRARAMTLNKQLDTLKSKPMDQRNEKAIELIKDRLQVLEELDSLRQRKKIGVADQEFMRFEKNSGETFLKKMIALLPKKIATTIKDKIGSTSEKDILKYIEYLFTEKK